MSLLVPGALPPVIIPFCGICDNPCERLSIFPNRSVYYLEIEGQCCGKHQGIRISIEELYRIKRNNEKLYLVVGKGHTQEIRKHARFG